MTKPPIRSLENFRSKATCPEIAFRSYSFANNNCPNSTSPTLSTGLHSSWILCSLQVVEYPLCVRQSIHDSGLIPWGHSLAFWFKKLTQNVWTNFKPKPALERWSSKVGHTNLDRSAPITDWSTKLILYHPSATMYQMQGVKRARESTVGKGGDFIRFYQTDAVRCFLMLFGAIWFKES